MLLSLAALRARKQRLQETRPVNQKEHAELVWQLEKWEEHVVRRKQDELGVVLGRNVDWLPAPRCVTLCDVPDEFYELGLPAKGRGPPDTRRSKAGMSPYWPWYPSPPPKDVFYDSALESSALGYTSDHEAKRYVERFDKQASEWQAGLPSFLARYRAEREQLERLERELAMGPAPDPDALRIMQNDVRAWVDPVGMAPNVAQHPELPPEVRRMVWHTCVPFEFQGGLLPDGRRLWLFSNAEWYTPPPSLNSPTLRLDGRLGEHKWTHLPQWYTPGKFYRAFCEAGYFADIAHRKHEDIDSSFVWYELSANALAQWESKAGIEGDVLYTAPQRLIENMEATWAELEKGIAFWRTAHVMVHDYPEESETAVRSAMRFLKTSSQTERQVRETLLGCQRYMRDLRAWVECHRRLNVLLELSEQMKQEGRLVARRADAEDSMDGLLPVVGLWTTVERIAVLAGQSNVPVWYLTLSSELHGSTPGSASPTHTRPVIYPDPSALGLGKPRVSRGSRVLGYPHQRFAS